MVPGPRQALEELSYFGAVGALILFLAAALGLLSADAAAVGGLRMPGLDVFNLCLVPVGASCTNCVPLGASQLEARRARPATEVWRPHGPEVTPQETGFETTRLLVMLDGTVYRRAIPHLLALVWSWPVSLPTNLIQTGQVSQAIGGGDWS